MDGPTVNKINSPRTRAKKTSRRNTRGRKHVCIFFFQAEDGIRDKLVTEFRRVLFRSFPQWIRMVVGVVEVGGAIALLIPVFAAIGASLLALLMVPATITQWISGEPGVFVPVILQTGRASCRERGEISVVDVSVKKK